jgi:hypothetical protein
MKVFIIACPSDVGLMGPYGGVINVMLMGPYGGVINVISYYIHIYSDVYSFLAAPSATVTSSGNITELIQESNADITSQGVLSYQYAARVTCVLSQQVDR